MKIKKNLGDTEHKNHTYYLNNILFILFYIKKNNNFHLINFIKINIVI